MSGRTKSNLIIFHGPVDSGKTLSMTTQAAFDLLNGRRVFSNYRISFRYNGKTYAAEPLQPEELVYIDKPDVKKKYSECIICIDEGALLMAARNFQDARNKLISQSMLLRGKLGSSVYITVQFLSMFEKNMRIQEDALVFCHDLHYKYPRQWGFGELISQAWQDISGRFTGYTYEETGRVYHQTLRGRPFWYIYDTKEMPSPVVTSKVKMSDIRNDIYELPDQEENNSNQAFDDDNYAIVNDVLGYLQKMNQNTVSPGTIKGLIYRHNPPFRGDSVDMDMFLISNGAIKTSNGNWSLRDLAVPV